MKLCFITAPSQQTFYFFADHATRSLTARLRAIKRSEKPLAKRSGAGVRASSWHSQQKNKILTDRQ